MKIALYLDFADILSAEKSLIDKLNHLLLPDAKHKMYKTQSIDHIMESLKKAGLDGLELLVPKELTDKNISEIKNLEKKYHLPILSIHQSSNNLYSIQISEIKRLCEIAKNLSVKIITLHSDVLGTKLFDIDFIEELKDLQNKYDVKFGIENMPKSPFNLDKAFSYDTDKFTSLIHKTGLSITLDTTHLGQTDGNLCNFYLRNKKAIVNIHLSDYKKNWLNKKLLLSNHTHLPLGKGELPIVEFLTLLKMDNYQGVITMEINANLNGLCESTRLIRQYLA